MIKLILCLSSLLITLASSKLSALIVSSTFPSNIFTIRCWTDSQGIVVEDSDRILAEFKEFDCGLGGGKHKNCVKETREVDGTWLTFRNCGDIEEKTGCKTDLSNVTKCYCSQDYCNSASYPVKSLAIISMSVAILILI